MSVFFQNSENVTNVKSVCNDGIIITHKIFIARNSEFIKHILIDIPIGDEAVLFPPDFHKDEGEDFLVIYHYQK